MPREPQQERERPPGTGLAPRRAPGWLLIALAALAALASVAFFGRAVRPRPHELRMTAGDFLGRRHQIARILADEARPRGVDLSFVETKGSGDALKRVAEGSLDVALIQGGQGDAEGVRQVASLVVEPMHLLVKREVARAVEREGLGALRARRVNLSQVDSGTRKLAMQTLNFAGLRPTLDYRDEDAGYGQLQRMRYPELPDALFTVSLMPSPVVEFLIDHHGYRLVPIPYGAALGLRDYTVREATIPAFAYGVDPPVPERDTPTVGTRLLLVAREQTPPEAVTRLLDAVYAGELARRANLPDLREEHVADTAEMALHPGTTTFLNRNQPLLTSDRVELLENGRSFLGSVALALFLLWRWARQRRYRGFEAYLRAVTRVEKEALALEVEATPSVRTLIRLRNELGALKTEALEKFASGELKGEELMAAFLTHVSDVRGHLNDLILAERERIADEARDDVPDAEQDARFRAEWQAALAAAEGARAGGGD